MDNTTLIILSLAVFFLLTVGIYFALQYWARAGAAKRHANIASLDAHRARQESAAEKESAELPEKLPPPATPAPWEAALRKSRDPLLSRDRKSVV